MNLTKQDIIADIWFITDELKNKDVVIPSFLSCVAPGIMLMLSIVAWQCFIVFPVSGTGKMDKLFSYSSVGASLLIGFFIFIFITSFRSKYLSIPSDITSKSIIFKMIKEKTRCYVLAWLAINIIVGSLVKIYSVDALFSSGGQLASFVIMLFIIELDFGRYDLALFKAAINAWRDVEKNDGVLKPN